jgi:hypothetical protein
MTSLRWIATHLLPAVVAAWWLAWGGMWQAIADDRDPDYQRDEKSRERNTGVHDADTGGGGWGAGTGSDSD